MSRWIAFLLFFHICLVADAKALSNFFLPILWDDSELVKHVLLGYVQESDYAQDRVGLTANDPRDKPEKIYCRIANDLRHLGANVPREREISWQEYQDSD